jgi:hypothetical protein
MTRPIKMRCVYNNCSKIAIGSYFGVPADLKKISMNGKEKKVAYWDFDGTPLCENHKKYLKVCENCNVSNCEDCE